jgi:3'-5' exoribonuclease
MTTSLRRFICQLQENEEIDQVFLASEKQLRPNRNGHLYLQLRVSDRTGTLNAMMWNANERAYRSFDNGDFLRVVGTTQLYNGNLQIIARQLERTDAGHIDQGDFVAVPQQQRDNLARRLAELLRSVQQAQLRELVEIFLSDDELMDQFSLAPAGIKNHHAYQGGLLEHVVNMIELVRAVAPHYPDLNEDLLVMGVLLHDIGKIRELVYERHLAYSDEGQLVGHVVLGVEIFNRLVAQFNRRCEQPFSESLAAQLKHLIVSHHGECEFGSPKVPMTLEAMALYLLDNLDAKLHHFRQLMFEDANPDSNWTTFQPNLGRKLFKSTASSRNNGASES